MISQSQVNTLDAHSGDPALSINDALGTSALRALRRPDGVFATVVGLSLVAHVALGAAFLINVASGTIGGGAVELETVSVSIVTVADLHATSNAGSATTIGPTEPTQDVPPATASIEISAVASDTGTPALAELVVPPTALDTAEPKAPPEIVPKPDATETKSVTEIREDRRAEPTPPSQVGSLPSAPVSVGGNSVGQAAASRGEVGHYARAVALVIGRNRPKGIGAKGRVTVEFSLSVTDGSVQASRVATPSGNARLDALALAVIGKAKYPAPPDGMTAAQLTFRVPFTFE